MILHFRVEGIEGTVDSEGEFLSPETLQDYLVLVARVGKSVWTSLPSEPTSPSTADVEGDTDA